MGWIKWLNRRAMDVPPPVLVVFSALSGLCAAKIATIIGWIWAIIVILLAGGGVSYLMYRFERAFLDQPTKE